MNRQRRLPAAADGGFALVDLVIGLALTATAAAMVAWLVTDTSTAAQPRDQGRADAALAVEVFARDLRESAAVEVLATQAGRVVRIDLVADRGRVTWSLAGSTLTREDLVNGPVRMMATGLDGAGWFMPLDATGAAIDIGDPDAVRACSRLVQVSLGDVDGAWTLDRVVAIRVTPGGPPCE